jgi:hypothetical protein
MNADVCARYQQLRTDPEGPLDAKKKAGSKTGP